MGAVHAGTGPAAAIGQAANPNLGVSIIRRKRRRRGLFGLPFWFFDCGRHSAARKATASADASGQSLVSFPSKRSAAGRRGKRHAQTLHSTTLLPLTASAPVRCSVPTPARSVTADATNTSQPVPSSAATTAGQAKPGTNASTRPSVLRILSAPNLVARAFPARHSFRTAPVHRNGDLVEHPR